MSRARVGVYLHTPFCLNKCNYCDFYSLTDHSSAEAYGEALLKEISRLAKQYPRTADTLYFGGGTPPIMGRYIGILAERVAKEFFLTADAEITCEVNPGAGYPVTVKDLAAMGINRLSVGLQSAVPAELSALGRRHTPQDVARLVNEAHVAGITNCSVDLMWGIPGQTVESALESLQFALSLAPTHISAYLLKIEPETPFGRMKNTLLLPSEDTVCDIYETCCSALEEAGFGRYEISNFSRAGLYSHHNMKYWNCEETLGIGPAAHSFMEGKRFFYPRDLSAFLSGGLPQADGAGGDFKEYAMLRIRLTDGLLHEDCVQRFGYAVPEDMIKKAKQFEKHGLAVADEKGIRFTVKGNLVSNALLAELL